MRHRRRPVRGDPSARPPSEAGLLQRVRSATDRRSVLLQLTEQKLAAFGDTIKKMLRNADGPIEQL